MAWLDANTLAGLSGPQSIQGSSAFDANNPLAYYQNQANNPFTYSFNPASSWVQGGGDSGGPTQESDGPFMLSSNGRALKLGADNTFMDTFDRPGGKGEREKVDVTYRYNPATGKVEPIKAAERFQGSDWTEQYRTPTAILASVLAAGAGGAALAGGGAGGGVAAGNGAFLGEGVASGVPAWDAAYTGAGGVFGSGGAAADAGGGFDGGDGGEGLDSEALSGSAPAYGGVGTSGAGAGTDTIIGADGLATSLGGTAAGGSGGTTSPGFWNSLANGNYSDALGSAGSSVGNYLSSPSGLQSLAGLLGSYYSANKQSDAANRAAQMSMDQYQQTRADNTPYRLAGYSALGSIADLMGTSGNTGAANYGSLTHQFGAGDLNANLAPNWKFQLDQGLGATQNAANASGFSGNALKGINDYAQNFAGNAYQQAYNNYTNNQTNIYNRLSNLAGLGQTSNGITAQSGTANTANAANYLTSGAAAQAGGIIGGVNSLNNGINNYQGWNYLNGRGNQNGSQP